MRVSGDSFGAGYVERRSRTDQVGLVKCSKESSSVASGFVGDFEDIGRQKCRAGADVLGVEHLEEAIRARWRSGERVMACIEWW